MTKNQIVYNCKSNNPTWCHAYLQSPFQKQFFNFLFLIILMATFINLNNMRKLLILYINFMINYPDEFSYYFS